MNPLSSKPVSANVLDAAIAWQLSMDAANPVEREEFAKWHAAHEEHARAWRQLGMLDQRFSVGQRPGPHCPAAIARRHPPTGAQARQAAWPAWWP